MENKMIVPFGSQHITLLEPVRFIFETENEKIVNVDVDVGYVHRGIEKACQTKLNYKQVAYIIPRICGLCAMSHALAYITAVEKILEFDPPKKAKYLRVLVHELDRIHSHLFAMAHVAEAAGYENLVMHLFRDRELAMECLEILTGNRVQYDYGCIGGVNRDLTPEVEKILRKKLKKLEDRIHWFKDLYMNDYTLSLRWKGIGVISKEMAEKYNAAGPVARASGVRTDARAEFDALPYRDLGFEMIVYKDGDIYSRNLVRLDEIFVSLRIIWNILDGLPEGNYKEEVKGLPKGESVCRWEAPRGELFMHVRGDGKQILTRVRVKTPTFSNIPVLRELFVGANYADVPAIITSFDPCMSCTAR
ncbi:MAG TPA: proton-conducting membrane transporter [Desulfurobacteriaceae bacterium]|nr:proton-conducting membrane transporter [Desulfurobacteriaceae bacterium]